MKRRDLLILPILAYFLPARAWAASSNYKLLNVSFQCSLPLGKPTKVGLDAVSASYSPDSDSPKFEVIVCEVGKEAFARMQQAGASPFPYCKTTFLGLSEAPTRKSSRKVSGVTRESEIYAKGLSPNKQHVEALWLERKEGAGVMLAFRMADSMAEQQASRAINEVCASFEWTFKT